MGESAVGLAEYFAFYNVQRRVSAPVAGRRPPAMAVFRQLGLLNSQAEDAGSQRGDNGMSE